jgi:hypothetical protein
LFITQHAELRPALGIVGQHDDVAGINQVRVLDLLVNLPYAGPTPRVLKEARRDIPKGIALDHGVTIGMVGGELDDVGPNRRGGGKDGC